MHFLIRCQRRTQYQNFFRVACGQIAQQFQKQGLMNFAIHLQKENSVTGTPRNSSKASSLITKLWKYRPFTRVVRGWKAYQVVRNYVQLNEQEALGNILYRKQRLRGLSMSEWEVLWG